MGAYEDAGQEARIRRERQEKREALKKLLRELDPIDVVFEIRDLMQERVQMPRERAILVRYFEDAAAWLLALESGRIPPLPLHTSSISVPYR